MSGPSTTGYDPAEGLGARDSAPGVDGADVGQYRLLSKLGEGGMGQVYKARHLRLKRDVAIKFLRQRDRQSTRLLQRFLQEMEALGQLDHPHIVRATDAGDWRGHPYLVMENLEGTDLFRLVRVLGPLAVADACAVIHQAALGLQYAYEKGLIHRDIKPSNLFLTDAGVIKVLDLGLVRLGGDADGPELTGVGEMLGTFDYMAPEQAANSHGVDIRADLYSLGCTLFFLLAGRPPFQGGPDFNVAQKIVAHAYVAPASIRDFRPHVPAPLADSIARLLAKQPEDRPAAPGDLCELLRPFVPGAKLASLMAAYRAKAPPAETAALELPFVGEGSPTLRAGSTVRAARSNQGPGRSRIAPALVAALAFGLALVLILWWTQGPGVDPDARPIDKGPTAPDVHDLLAVEPAVLLAPKKDFHRAFDPVKRELHFDTVQACLFRLGEAATADFQFEVRFRRNFGTGSAGLFFGFRKEQDKTGLVRTEFLTFTHRIFVSPDGKQEHSAVELDRQWLIAEPKRSGARPVFAAHLPGPLPRQEHRLALRVRRGQIVQLLFDHHDLTDRVGGDAAPAAGELVGVFGIYGTAGATFITSARSLPSSEDK